MGMAFAIQFLVSLLAIAALAWLAARLSLGKTEGLRGEDHARLLAEQAAYGFNASEVALDRNAQAALLRDDKGRVMLLRRHGAHYASRWLGPATQVEQIEGAWLITPDDAAFGSVRLDIGDRAPEWLAPFAAKAPGNA